MKFKTTKKEIYQNYKNVICVSYCKLDYLLTNHEPIAYNSGVDGWKCDIYDINGVAIVTGYQPFGNIRPDYNIIKKYEDEARKICGDSWGSFQNMMDQVDQLLNQFIEEVTR